MRFYLSVTVLLLAAFSNAAEIKSRSRQKSEETSKTEKRELAEGNAGVEKRLAVLPTDTPGIVYADSKDGALGEKSRVQQIYATPAPPIAKISDVFTGHGPAFPAAIASHLYSPVSIYQPKLATPTTYEVSAPVPSQLAYAEKISYQNPVQFTTQVLYNQPQPQQINFPRYNAVQVQQAFHQQIQQQNPRLFTHPQTFQAAQTQAPQVLSQPQYQSGQNAQSPQSIQNAQAIYSQIQQRFATLAQAVQPQPGVVYARQENGKEAPRPAQRELNNKDQLAAGREKLQSQNYNTQPQSAVSFASFSQAPPTYNQQQQQTATATYNQQQQQQAQIQNQNAAQLQSQNQAQLQYQTQVQPQYQTQIQPQYQSQVQPQFLIQVPQYRSQVQPQPQPPIQYQPQPQGHFQIQIPQYQPQLQFQQPQFISKLESPAANSIATAVKQAPARQVVYLRPQEYQSQPTLIQQGHPQPGLAFPAVQYFGKFAQEIFGGYQHNQ